MSGEAALITKEMSSLPANRFILATTFTTWQMATEERIKLVGKQANNVPRKKKKKLRFKIILVLFSINEGSRFFHYGLPAISD